MERLAPTVSALDVPEDARCLGCGYSLVQLTSPRCPECGRFFNPAQPETYDSASWRASQVRHRHRLKLEQLGAEPAAEYRQFANVSLGIALVSLLSMPWLLGLVCLVDWLVLGGICLRELSRWRARRVLNWPRLERPVLGRYAWKALAISLMAALAPLPMALAFFVHLPLFANEAKEIAAGSFHAHPPARLVGLTWVEVDRCPHAIYFIAPQHGNPFSNGVTLVRRTSAGPCEHAEGVPLWKDWSVKLGKGRGRDPPY